MASAAPSAKDHDWAVKALVKAGYGEQIVVHRVYAPYDAQDPIEVIFISATGLARTALMDPKGKILKCPTGWVGGA